MVKKDWQDISALPISDAAIRMLHQPNAEYRFSPNKYDAGVRFPKTVGLAYTVYVLEGQCKYVMGDVTEILCAQELLLLEKGRYEFEVLGEEPVSLINVFHIPERFRQRTVDEGTTHT